jgi:hypothetical protein
MDARAIKLFQKDISVPCGLVGFTEAGLAQVYTGKWTKPREGFVSMPEIVEMRLGKLMARLGYDNGAIKHKVEILKSILLGIDMATVEFATHGDDIYELYREAEFYSCMKGNDAVKAYGGPDTAMAYIRMDGNVVARTIVSTIEKIYVRAYGFTVLIESKLQEMGYERGDLDGHRLERIETGDGNSVLCPYLDCDTTTVDDDGDYLVIADYGEYDSNATTDGVVGEVSCPSCGESHDRDQGYYVEERGDTICESCFEADWVMDDWGNTFPREYAYVYNGYIYNGEEDDEIVTVDNEYRHMDEVVWSDYEGDYILVEDSVCLDYKEDHCKKEDAKHSEYAQEWYLTEDVCTAVTDLDYPEGEIVFAEDTAEYRGVRYHNDIIDEVIEMNPELDL